LRTIASQQPFLSPESAMRVTTLHVALVLASVAFFGAVAPRAADAQSAGRRAPHVITVKMVEKNGGASYAFEPQAVNAIPGDTLRFVQTNAAPHDVDFKAEPKGAKVDAEVVPYLTNQGQTFDLVIDKRFVPGTYSFVCDPHESMGMKGTLTVTANP
jgi:plastocyanin